MTNKLRNIDPEKLGKSLRDVLLCSMSPMAAAATQVLKAWRFGLHVEIVGKGMPGFNLLVQIVKALGLGFNVSDIPGENTMRVVALAQTPVSDGVRAIVPPMSQRAGDMCVLLPFYIQLHLTKFRKRVPDFPEPKIDNLYLLSIWPHLLRTPQPLSPRVFRDLLSSETSGLLTVPAVLRGIPDHLAEARFVAEGLSERARRYLGFCGGNAGWELLADGSMKSHPYNKKIWNILSATTVGCNGGTSGQSTRGYPWLLRQYKWDVATMGLVARNAHLLGQRNVELGDGESERINECLIHRLKGKTQSEISEDLGFEDNASYCQWTKKHYIDVVAGKPGRWYQDWLDACELFGLEPDPAMMEAGYDPADDREEGPVVSGEGRRRDAVGVAKPKGNDLPSVRNGS